MQRIWNNTGLWRLATLVALGSIAAMAFVGAPGRSATTSFLAVLQPEQGVEKGGWIIEIAPDRSIRLTPLGRTEVPQDRSLQLWTLIDQSQGPQSLGLVQPDEVNLLQPGAVAAIGPQQLFEISLEPVDGSPTGRPTGPILFKGTATEGLR